MMCNYESEKEIGQDITSLIAQVRQNMNAVICTGRSNVIS
jgi:hypothetical protein